MFQAGLLIINLCVIFWKSAAWNDSFESGDVEASEELDMAICDYPACLLCSDDGIAVHWGVSKLAQLGIHRCSEYIDSLGHVFVAHLLPRLCQRIGTTRAALEVHMHQGDCFLRFLAGKCSFSQRVLCFILTRYTSN